MLAWDDKTLLTNPFDIVVATTFPPMFGFINNQNFILLKINKSYESNEM